MPHRDGAVRSGAWASVFFSSPPSDANCAAWAQNHWVRQNHPEGVLDTDRGPTPELLVQ